MPGLSGEKKPNEKNLKETEIKPGEENFKILQNQYLQTVKRRYYMHEI